MANIPGLLGYKGPNAYSIARTRTGTVALPGGARITCIVGLGQTETVLVSKAVGEQQHGTGNPTTDVAIVSENVHVLEKWPILDNATHIYVDGVELAGSQGNTSAMDEWTYNPQFDEYYLAPIDEDGVYVAGGVTDSSVVAAVLILLKPLKVGEQLVISYVAQDDINDPETFFDPEELFRKHGYPSVTNTLALGAQIAFENGAPAILACQAMPQVTKSSDADQKWKWLVTDERGHTAGTEVIDTNWAETFTELEKEEMNFLCVLPQVASTDLTPSTKYYFDLFAAAKTHVEKMSATAYRKERILMIGSPTISDVNKQLFYNVSDYFDNVYQYTVDTTYGVEATYGTSFRVQFFIPDQIVRVVNGEVEILPGWYMAIAGAGYLSASQNLPEPLTRKDLVGFNILKTRRFNEVQMDAMGGTGVTVVIPLTSGGRVRHSLTTVNSGEAVEEEPSVVGIRDFVAKTMRDSLEAAFVGHIITPAVVGQINARAGSILNSIESQGIIVAFANLNVTQDTQEPRQANVFFDIEPVYPLNWLRIEFSIGLL